MDKPLGFTVPRNSKLVCRLRRSLYGPKQSPRDWFGHFNSALIQFGMTRQEADNVVFFFLHSSAGRRMFLVVYIDDIIITRDDTKSIQRLKTHFFNKKKT